MSRLICLLCACLATACGLPPAPHEQTPPPFELRLGSGDVLTLNVYGEAKADLEEYDLRDLSVTVGPDGTITVPLIGSVPLRGLTMDEARVEVAQRLRVHYQEPTVSLALREVRSHVVHVLGEVTNPGAVPYVQGSSVMGAIQAAGGPLKSTADLDQVRLIRDRFSPNPIAYEHDVAAVLLGERPDAWLLPGDVVFVPPRSVTVWERWWRQAIPFTEPLRERDR